MSDLALQPAWLTRFTDAVSVRPRLILVIVVILLAGFVATELVSYELSMRRLRDDILRNQLPLVAQTIASRLDSDIDNPVQIARMMARDAFLRQWLKNPTPNASDVTRYLIEIQRDFGMATAFVAAARTGDYYDMRGLIGHLDRNNPADAWYYRATEQPLPYIANIAPSDAAGHAPTVFINYRIIDENDGLLGLAGTGVQLARIDQLLAELGDNGRRRIYFVDQQGLVPAGDAGGNDIRQIPGLAGIANQLLSGTVDMISYDRGDTPVLLTSMLLPGLDWHLVIEETEARAIKPFRQSTLISAAVGLASLIVVAGLLAAVVDHFQRRLEKMATTDRLTELGNRHYFDLTLAAAVARFQRDGRAFSIISFDIDHFKRINDELGHLVGDAAIRAVAQAIKHNIRAGDIACRWGGEEIAVLAHGCTQDEAIVLADKLREAIAHQPFLDPDTGRRITASAGVAEATAGDGPATLMARADAGLYAAKEAGRNCTRAVAVLPQEPSPSEPESAKA